jgi:hypothetical protein
VVCLDSSLETIFEGEKRAGGFICLKVFSTKENKLVGNKLETGTTVLQDAS